MLTKDSKKLILFAGGEGVGEGLKMLNLHGPNTYGIELDEDIADVARMNGHETRTANILDVDPADYGKLDLLHMSPPCPNFSAAKVGGEETDLDIALASKCAEFVRVCQPEWVTIENVMEYRKAKSWERLKSVLLANGYGVDGWVLNSADYGVPQTRKRFIAIGSRDGRKPPKPPVTHYKLDGKKSTMGKRSLFWKPWIGWYEAIADIADELPDTQFANWQMIRLPEPYLLVLHQSGYDIGDEWERLATWLDSEAGEAHRINSVFINPNRSGLAWAKATDVIAQDGKSCAMTSSRKESDMAALLVPGGNRSSFTLRKCEQPSTTVVSSAYKAIPRAFLVDGMLNNHGEKITVRGGVQPSNVVTTSHNRRDVKAFLVHCSDTRTMPVIEGNLPAFSKLAGPNFERAYVTGRIVSITPRAAARFQSFPDSYTLPAAKRLAYKVIGNAVPPLLYAAVIRSLVQRG